MLKQTVNAPMESEINLTSATVASALLVNPINFMPFLTCPRNWPWTWVARLKVSMFKIVEDVEYEAGTPAPGVYGFVVNTFVGSLYGPSLWFGAANLNINVLSLDSTVSPIENTPEVILISSNFGVVNLVTSILSK